MKKIINKNKLCSQKGMTLLEVIVAIALLVTGMLAIAQMQIAAIQGNAAANRMSQAITLASDKVEKLIRATSNDPDLSTGDHKDLNNPVNGFDILWNIKTEGSAKYIHVTVQWKDHMGNTKKTHVDYIRAD